MNPLHTLVERFDQSDSAVAPMHMNYITRLHPHALELCGRTVYGPPSYMLAFTLSGIALIIWHMWDFWVDIFIGKADSSRIIGRFLIFFFPAITLAVPILVTLFLPSETPIIFDRKHQKVHWVTSMRGNLLRRFLLRPAVVRSYDWSRVEISHTTSPMVGSNIQLMHFLMFTVRDARGEVEDEYGIAHITQPVPCLWSYIHGYMNGTIHPRASDVQPGDGEIMGYWDIITHWAPYLRPGSFVRRFKELPKITITLCLLAPLVWAWLVVYLFTKVLADLTAQKLYWPQSVLDALGPEISTYDPTQDGLAPRRRYRRKVLKGV